MESPRKGFWLLGFHSHFVAAIIRQGQDRFSVIKFSIINDEKSLAFKLQDVPQDVQCTICIGIPIKEAFGRRFILFGSSCTTLPHLIHGSLVSAHFLQLFSSSVIGATVNEFEVWSLSKGALLRNIAFPTIIDAIALDPAEHVFYAGEAASRESLEEAEVIGIVESLNTIARILDPSKEMRLKVPEASNGQSSSAGHSFSASEDHPNTYR
ncbi:protein ROOT INITIATION DEFECTIVE 3 [Senna tora]|uniref:Protein ROOT INITIATION DEFECTIVE 3 n=1 Tax=Senna tora TaxID=362788 RepID=A0A834W3Z6_9FABA|nr:protein ROOT INITIATION DEFECTIVE 3 [Senna tora]